MIEAPKETSSSGNDELSRFGTLNNSPLNVFPIKWDGSNYLFLFWSRSFTLAITANGLLIFITGPIPPPAATSPRLWNMEYSECSSHDLVIQLHDTHYQSNLLVS